MKDNRVNTLIMVRRQNEEYFINLGISGDNNEKIQKLAQKYIGKIQKLLEKLDKEIKKKKYEN